MVYNLGYKYYLFISEHTIFYMNDSISHGLLLEKASRLFLLNCYLQ